MISDQFLPFVLTPVPPAFSFGFPSSFSAVLTSIHSRTTLSSPFLIPIPFVSPPKGLLLLFSFFKFSSRLTPFPFSFNLYRYPLVLPASFSKFRFLAFVPVLTLPDFQTPNDTDLPKIPGVPASPQLPENRPRNPPRFAFEARRPRPQKRRQVKPRPKERPSVTDTEATWSTGIYPYSLIEHATTSRREQVQNQSLCNWYGRISLSLALLTTFSQPSYLPPPVPSRLIF